MYLGAAAGGLFSGLKARDEMDINQELVNSKRLLASRQLKNQQMTNYLKLLEEVGKNPVAALEAVRGAGAEDLADNHRAALLARAHREIPDYLAYQQKLSKMTGLPEGAGRYTNDPRLWRDTQKDEQNVVALREGLQLFPTDPTGFQKYLTMKGISPDALEKYATSLYPTEMAQLKSHTDYWKALSGRVGADAGGRAASGAMPGRPAPAGTPTVAESEAQQKGREARLASKGQWEGQYDVPLRKQLAEMELRLKQAQLNLANARIGSLEREQLFDEVQRLNTMANALRTLIGAEAEAEWFKPENPTIFDLSTGETLPDRIRQMIIEHVQRLPQGSVRGRSLPIPRPSAAPAPAPKPAEQVPNRPNILDIKRLD